MKIAIVLLVAMLFSGCTTLAGPFVTNVSHDGEGRLLVDRCNVTYNAFLGTVGNANCNSSTVKIWK